MKQVLTHKLVEWYDENDRDLPWKQTNDPYKIWLSEIILQQTRVEQGKPYYLNFVAKYPTVDDLAAAPIDEVLKLWEGLGYYSRARNLHAAAKFVVHELNSEFPKTAKELLNLKGVGEYTAAAIATFAYDEAIPVVDGNVYRVLSRIFGIHEAIDTSDGKKLFKAIAEQELNHKQPAIYNQAIMNFGALVCTPKKPNCLSCVFQEDCIALREKSIDKLPFKSKKLIKKHRYFNYYLLFDEEHIYIQQRNENDIWKLLFEFPLIESQNQLDLDTCLNSLKKNYKIEIDSIENVQLSKPLKQTLTHLYIHAQFAMLKFSSIDFMEKQANWTLIKRIHLEKYAFPRVIRTFLSEWTKLNR